MLQKGSILNVIDNSGARLAVCIHNVSSHSSKYFLTNHLVLLSVRKLRVKRRYASKIKKGALAYGLIVRTKKFQNTFFGDQLKFYANSVVLFFKKTTNLIGTRIFGFISNNFRYSRYLKITAICTGVE